MILQIQGSSVYDVDTTNVTCTCRDFVYRRSRSLIGDRGRLCKHLSKALEEHPEVFPAVYTQTTPTATKAVEETDGKTRFPRFMFDSYVETISTVLRKFDGVLKFQVCGSYRRNADMVSDLDVLLVMKDPEDTKTFADINSYLENICGYELIQNIGKGDCKSAYMADGYVHIDFKVVPLKSWGFALAHFTGPANFNIACRMIASRKGYSLSEYGLKNKETEEFVDIDPSTEENFFKFLGIKWHEPWQRQQYKDKNAFEVVDAIRI